MKALRNLLDKLHPHFAKGGKLEKLYPLFEAADSFAYTPGEVTDGAPHVRDAIDLKRVMITVVIALIPCFFMAMWNTGFQANSVLQASGGSVEGWRGALLALLGFSADPNSFVDNLLLGAAWFVPIYLVTNIVGGLWEALFSIVRGHEINEGFLVTGSLFPLICPPTLPLWQVALGISFGVVVGKEIFGGTGKNFLNPALTGRAFLFFAYPAQLSGGNSVWIAADGASGATALGRAAEGGVQAVAGMYSWFDAFVGTIPGSMGETSTLACLFGATILVLTGIGSWRIMLSCLLGALSLSALFLLVDSSTNPMFALGPHWHLVLGGFAFGLVFMTTDPVSGAMTEEGQWLYGLLIGAMCILIRVVNPAYPEGIMLAILFGNVFAPLIDQLVLKYHIKRRLRHVEG
ncbi:MAG: NADH:ubiquinone reductase (Na(+)-transporting) subunit B [Deltaproteobacteria bacterium]|jgi:Na+-transporting NADH:ubiquinone oxidoreductase subunit B|nr:NADH:ubiquinone reductase (Na(+)-transporting) subunit B [Deltaproteobacteria bacterium]MCW8893567.1 NADH:ubiquinone reductase (Na(+)-transporting) subunit B [Deltaproteobacteria bacterium]MCW9050480.1 NADH:ubiquinone reductase (Na(+)-transporting) subunit B [Deltaproteobacteria bacterium]